MHDSHLNGFLEPLAAHNLGTGFAYSDFFECFQNAWSGRFSFAAWGLFLLEYWLLWQ